MKFVIYSQDKEGAIDIRKANREAHLAFIKIPSNVKLLSAGPWLDDAAETMIGSLLIVEAKTIADVKKWLADDPYAKAGLPENVNIHPFIWAIGAP